MTLNEFVIKWNGKYLEVAGSANAKYQCVDLANGYIRDVLGLSIIEWTNAVDFPSKVGDNYEYIKNTLTNVPKEGDIVVWKPSPGHIAVFIEGNANTFKSFDQNFPIGSPCHVQNHDYTNVTGWLRFKGNQATDLQILLSQSNKDRDEHYNNKMELFGELGGEGKYNHSWAVTEIQQLRIIAKEQPEKDELIRTLREELRIAKEKLEKVSKDAKDIQGTADATHAAAGTVIDEAKETIDKVDELEKKTDEASRGSRNFLDFILEWLSQWKLRR